MATVEQNLIQILTARYGSQVRQAIHDSIRDCYENMSGRLLTVPKGVYDEEEIYELMDLVTQDGVVYLYVSQTPLAGTSLEDITKWAKLYLSAETTIDAASILDGTISFDKLSSALIQQLKNLDITENSAIIGLAAQISSLSENTTNQLSDISDILNDHENGIESALEELSSLATKISEKVQTFWQTNTPSTPWTTPELKNSHIGDYWYNPETKETKRWSGLAWEKILNDEADSAMRLAASKGKIFVSEPVAPYSIGDLWITSLVPEEGIIKVCTADNESSPFSETHWVSVFQGTGSSALTEFINGAYFDDQLDIDNRLTALTSALGVYISDIRVQYYSSTSPLVLNGGEWSEATPERVSGRYIWTRTALVKTDESVIYRPNISGICISGVDGAPGSVDGEVTNIKYQYYFSSSGLVLEDGEWADAYAPPEDPEDLFLWTRVVVSFSNKADLSTTPVRFFPSEGAQGPPGSIGPIGYTGSTGIQGYTGSKGDLGYTGSRGYVGSQGAPGLDGSDGSPGTPGVTGSQGYTGSQGPEGPVGYTGSKGDKGDAGEQGPQGPQGPIGSIGPDGAQGPPGLDGEDGNDGAPGAQGPIGYTGSMGYTGSRGAAGTDGAPGANGDPGPAGPKGDPGTIGPIGYTGSKGDKGDSGSPGTPGSPGAQGAVGYTGSQGLQGGTGPQGDPGRAGYTGSQGLQGDTGYTGSRGFVGSQGVQGVQGIIGLTGSQGIQGPIGYTGSKGDTGLQGPIGHTGSQGFSGSKGDTGDGVAALADWAKSPTKPTYTPSEVGAAPEIHNHDTSYLGISATAANSDKLDGYHAGDLMVGNPNLLHNWDFSRPINQRGCALNAYLPAGYSLDMWSHSSGFQYVEGMLYVPLAGTHYIVQKIEGNFTGKTLTATVRVGPSNYWYSAVTNVVPAVDVYTSLPFPSLSGVHASLIQRSTYLEFGFIATEGAMPCSALKLELGSISTLRLDPPMDYGAELLKCQRYLQVKNSNGLPYANIGIRYNYTAGYWQGWIPMTVKMRISPTVSVIGTWSGAQSISLNAANGAADILYITATAPGAVAGETGGITINNDPSARIIFSAEL